VLVQLLALLRGQPVVALTRVELDRLTQVRSDCCETPRLAATCGIERPSRRTRATASRLIVEYLGWFNNDRLHESLARLTPLRRRGAVSAPRRSAAGG
jgi:transposase InsO family protein